MKSMITFSLFLGLAIAACSSDYQPISQGEEGWQDSYYQALRKLARCSNLESPDLCRSTIYYELGYLFETTEDPAVAMLDSSTHYYGRALDLFPNDRTLKERLAAVYTRQEKYAEALTLLQGLYREVNINKARYALQISQNLFRTGEYEESFAMARRSISHDPNQEAGWKNLVKVMELHSPTFPEVEALAYEAHDHGFINEALEMLEVYIRQNHQTADMEAPVVHWCNLLLETQGNYQQRLNRLPGQEGSAYEGIAQLHRLFALSQKEQLTISDLQSLDFWYSKRTVEGTEGQVYPYNIILKYLNAQAKNLLGTNKEKAIAFYEKGMQMIRDLDVRNYQLTGVYFDFASSYADILLLYPDLDPDERKLDLLIRDLFSGKGFAYGDEDREMIKRFHITLGMIYAKRNKWRGGYATNARFQITNALRNTDPDEQIPILHELLGDGQLNYLNDPEGAFSSYLTAAEQYLNQDALPNAKKLIDLVKENANRLNADQRKKVIALESLYLLRTESRTVSAAGDYRAHLQKLRNEIERLDLDPATRNIQVFKLYATVGQGWKEGGQPQQYCFLQALGLTNTLNSVPSYTDLLRIENMAGSIRNKINTDAEFTRVNKFIASPSSAQPARQITYNGIDENPISLTIEPVLYQLTDLLETVPDDNQFASDISYYNDQLIFKENVKQQEVRDYFEKNQNRRTGNEIDGYQMKIRNIE